MDPDPAGRNARPCLPTCSLLATDGRFLSV
ncbi:hypothetical protein BN1263350006 [Stenotrophomonas indicatrix]|nr:hypothetical protein BN1263350006 [Stenotrophomonas indicatrix]